MTQPKKGKVLKITPTHWHIYTWNQTTQQYELQECLRKFPFEPCEWDKNKKALPMPKGTKFDGTRNLGQTDF